MSYGYTYQEEDKYGAGASDPFADSSMAFSDVSIRAGKTSFTFRMKLPFCVV